MVFNKKLEYYYDYFRNNNQIVVLLGYNENGFSDDQLAAFAILSLDNGNSKEDYHAITEKYFSRKIINFNNSRSEIIPVTNMVRGTGWSYNSNVFLILKNLLEEEGILKRQNFMCLI
ncbi:MAG: hypothetical protein KGZ94_04600 [Clostridia bacterium]|jgi:hypothetical protein|nr:hypothetical protein [Clostridia bacterium]